MTALGQHPMALPRVQRSPLLNDMAEQARAELLRIADWWARNIVDHERGGFHGEIGHDGRPHPTAHRSVVLDTRLLWFFSAAAARLGSRECLALADRAADYILQRFVDPANGGLFWTLDAAGTVVSRRKQAYAQAFGVYAFAAHFAAGGRRSSLDAALDLFSVLETRFLDRDGDGYWEALAEDFTAVADMRLSERDVNAPKTLNAHLHVLEAYAALYRIRGSPEIASALSRAIRLMCERVYDEETRHLRLFFDARWRPLDHRVSFGHDIEASWLIWEAAQALGLDYVLPIAKACAVDLADAAFAEALGPNGEVFEERAGARLSQRRVWWIQAEGLIGFLNAHELTKEQRFLDASARLWRFIQLHQIEGGAEWREFSTLDRSAARSPKAGPWKCPYHTARAMMEMERRAATLGGAQVRTVLH
jgi:cellobiose epimerase